MCRNLGNINFIPYDKKRKIVFHMTDAASTYSNPGEIPTPVTHTRSACPCRITADPGEKVSKVKKKKKTRKLIFREC